MTDYSVLKVTAKQLIDLRGTSLELPTSIYFERIATPEAVLALIAERDQLFGETERLKAESEALRFALKRIVKSTYGAFPVDHRIDVHVSTIELAKRTLWPDATMSKEVKS